MKNNIYKALPIVALLLVGCQKEAVEYDSLPTKTDMKVSIITEPTVRSTTPHAGTDIGVTINYTAPSVYDQEDVKWDKISDIWVASEDMLWKNNVSEATVYAYAPYVTPTAGAINYSVKANQSILEEYVASEFYGYSGTFTPNEANGQTMPITLKRKMVKVTIVFNDVNIDVVAATLANIKTDISYNIKSETATTLNAPTSNINAYKEGLNTFSAIIPAQSIAGNTLFVSYSTEYNNYTAESVITGYSFTTIGESYTINVAAN